MFSDPNDGLYVTCSTNATHTELLVLLPLPVKSSHVLFTFDTKQIVRASGGVSASMLKQ